MPDLLPDGDIPARRGMSPSRVRARAARLAWVPIPLFIVAIGLLARVDPYATFEPRLLLPALNFVFLTAVPLLASFLAARSYRRGEPAGVLLLGCGMLAFALAGALSAVTAVLEMDVDATVTVHNVGASLAALCCLASAALTARPDEEDQPGHGLAPIAAAYGTVAVATGLVIVLRASNVLPPFFVAGQGATPVRQVVLGSAIVLFGLTAGAFRILFGRAAPAFVRWYSLALILIAVGLAGVFIQHAVGSPVGWAGRLAQYIGCLYIFLAVLSLGRESGGWHLPLDRALRETRDRYRALVDASPDGVIVHRDGHFLYANSAALRLYGVESLEELQTRTVLDLIHPDERPAIAERMRRGLAEGRVPLRETRLVRFDGRVVPVEAVGGAVDYGGKPAGQILIRDITERKQAEQAIQEHARQLEEANRLKDEFLATLSHELRTPLNAILGWAELLIQGRLGPDATHHALDVIARNARLQARLIDDVLDVSRIVMGKLRLEVQPTDVALLVEAAIDALALATDARRVTILTDFPARPAVAVGDPARLQQVFWNLLSNAVKFTPAGGCVEVSVRQADAEIEVRVRDTGIGIDPAFLPRVFQRFTQYDSSSTRARGGLGLGLAVVRHVVELHGGTVTAESPGEGHGATFTVVLPGQALFRAPAGADLASPWAAEGEAEPVVDLQGVHVLAVDDEEDTRELLQAVLAGAGAEVALAASAAEALPRLAGEPPDVLVCDIGMPDVDGCELIRQVRAQGMSVPAIALTAYGRDDDRVRVLAAGFQLHLPKPVPLARLLAAVKGLAEGRRVE